MPTSIDILTFILAFIVLYFVVALLLRFRREDVFKQRLNELMNYKERLIHAEDVSEEKAYQPKEDEGLSWLKRIVNKIQRSGAEEQEKLKIIFDKAGLRSRNAFVIYGIVKVMLALSLALMTTVIVFYFFELNFFIKVGAIIIAALLGSYLADFILLRLAKARQDRIRKAFPDALDLMVICTEAGLSLTATVQRVAREISQISPDLGYELALLSIEMNMLSDQQRALQNFSDRLDSPYFKSIITNIIQAQQYGTPIAQTMRTIAEQFRLDRLVEAEERAAKLPVIMSIPMMGLIFPCIYIVILGPAVIKVMASL